MARILIIDDNETIREGLAPRVQEAWATRP